MRDSLEFLFRQRGYVVLAAQNGAEALARAAENEIDGAIVDVNMPGMNGIDVCRALRTQAAGRGRNIAVWIMTGARTLELSRQATEAGALALFGKPFDLAELFQHFEAALGPQALPKPVADVLDEL